VPVPYVVGDAQQLAERKIRQHHLKPRSLKRSSPTVAKGTVIDQDPSEGTRVAKDSVVKIWVSTGKPRVRVPNVVGQTRDTAVAMLAGAGLKANPVGVYSSKPADQITGQSLPPGVLVVKGTTIRINYSRGLAPITVPNVTNENVDVASGQLQGAGFVVATKYVDNAAPKDQVISQDPQGGSSAPRGSTVHLTVSKGPKTVTVPDTTGYSQADAISALKSAGLTVSVTKQNVTDPSQDGLVIDQTPAGGTQEPKGTTVTITVGKYTGPGPPG
jgi:serine/threonine-protein kinase